MITEKEEILKRLLAEDKITFEEMLLLQRVTAMKIPQMCKVYEK